MRLIRVPAAAVAFAVLSLVLAQTVLAAHPAWRSGAGGIQPTWAMDLDNGTFNVLAGGDIFLDAVTDNLRYLNNNSGALILRMATKPSYAACAHATMGDHQYKTSRNVGRWFCVETDQQRFARVQITKDQVGGDLFIKFRTWCDFGDACVA